MNRTRSAPNPAQNIISGTIDKEQTWYEDVVLTADGAPLTDVDDHDWVLEIYREPGCAPDLTLSTDAGTLSINESDETVLSIRCASSRLSSLCGDYWIDIKSTDPDATVDGEERSILRGRGTVTITEGPG